MPFESQAQRGFLFKKHPKVAKEFAAHTPKGAKLPYHAKPPQQKGFPQKKPAY